MALFATDEETFGESSENIPSGSRIFVSLLHRKETGKLDDFSTAIQHGVMGDGTIRVACYKQGLPSIFELDDSGEINEIKYCNDEIDYFEYEPITFEYKGYSFKFTSDVHYQAIMTEPDGTLWECTYDYGYGAGFEADD